MRTLATKKQKQVLCAVLAVIGVVCCGTYPSRSIAAPVAQSVPAVFVDGWEYSGDIYMVEDTAYVILREFACAVDNAVVTWLPEEACAVARTDALEVCAWEQGAYLLANDRPVWCPHGTFTRNGSMYVPLTAVSLVFGFDHGYANGIVTLTRTRAALPDAETVYNREDLYWLAKIIHAEAKGEPLTGKIAVGEVVLNRVRSTEFPNTVYGVVFDNQYGVQFTPTVNGAIEEEPCADAIIAAKLALDGVHVGGDDVLYFLNPVIATSMWIPENRSFRVSIGTHDFYA